MHRPATRSSHSGSADAGETAASVGSGWLRVGQLAAATGETAKTLRFYDEAGVLAASARTAAGYRLYAPAMIERVGLVRAAQSVGLSLDEIASLFDDQAGDDAVMADVLARIERTQQGLAELHRWVTDRTR